MKTLCDLLFTLLFYVGLTASCLGGGHYMGRLLGLRMKMSALCLGEIWLGLCGVIFLLQVVHCVVPLNFYSSTVIYGVGLLLLMRAYLMHRFVFPWKDLLELGRIAQISLVILTTWVALQAMKTTMDYDGGLYHFTAVRWMNEYAIVSGLGNLHGRLACNFTYFLFAASLNFFPFFNHGHNLGIGWLSLLVIAECLFYFNRVWSTFRRQQYPALKDIIPAVLLPYVLYAVGQMDFASLQVDLVVFFMRILLFIYLWRNLASEDKLERLECTAVLMILGITAVTVKLSMLLFPMAICLITIVRSYLDENKKLVSLIRNLLRPMLFACLILFTWMSRGVITSGYPAYPMPYLPVHTDWTIPLNVVDDMQRWICSWSRVPLVNPDITLKDSRWLGYWLSHIWRDEKVNVVTPLLISLGAGGLITASLVEKVMRRKQISPLYLGVIPIVVGLAAWFHFAPDQRFANGLFWLLPLASLGAWILSQPNFQRNLIGTLCLAILMSIPLLFHEGAPLESHLTFPTTGWQPIPKVALQEEITSQGLKVYFPLKGDQCCDGPLPNTPYFYAGLELRGQGLQSGFKSSPELLSGEIDRTQPNH